jgi:membrane protein
VAPPASATNGVAARRAPNPALRVLRRLLRKAWDDDVLSESASTTFWQTLSLPPLLLGLFGVLGFVGDWFGPDTVAAVQQWIINVTSGLFSRNAVEEIFVPTVADVLTTARGEVVSVGFVLSFWSGSSAMASYVDAITRAHDQFPVRGWLWQRTLAILLYLVGLAIGIVLLPVAALGPDRMLPLLPDGLEPAARAVLGVVYYPVVGLVLVLALTTLYKIALPFKMPWHRGLPGAFLAAVVFLVGVTGLRWYLDWITGTGYTYGALAAPIAFLLGMFFIALAVILGAHLNAAVQFVWPAPLRRRGRLVEHPPAAHDEPTAPVAAREPASVPDRRDGRLP